MIDRLLGLLAFSVLAAFLGILAWKVATLDLLVVIGATLLLAGYDLLTTHGRARPR